MVKFTPRLPAENVNVTPVSPLREFFALIAGLTGVTVVIYFLLGFAIDLIVPHISPEMEHALAQTMVSRFTNPEKPDERTISVRALTNRLKQGCTDLPYPVTVYIAEDPLVNAVALPGGNIVVFSGLLEKMGSENELAFVLFHEMGHFINRDHLRGLGRAIVFMGLSALLLGPDNPVSTMIGQGLHLSEMKFSREQETGADRFALRAMNCAYGHVAGATNFFEKLAKAEKPAGAVGQFYLTHPESQKRIADLQAYGRKQEFSFMGTLRPFPEKLR